MRLIIISSCFAFALGALGQIQRQEVFVDTGRVILHYHEEGAISTKEWRDRDDRFGVSTAYDRNGREIFRYGTRRIGGHASVNFRYHENGAISRAEVSDAPDGGIQWYKSVTTFDPEGNQTGFQEYGRDNYGPIPGPGTLVERPGVIGQRMFVNEVFLVNATRKAGKANVRSKQPSPGLKDSQHTLAPGDSIKLGI